MRHVTRPMDAPPTDEALSEHDARTIIRLLGELAAMQADYSTKKRYLMNGVRDLIDADAWLWSVSAIKDDDMIPVNMDIEGIDREDVEMWVMRRISNPDEVQPEDETILKQLVPGQVTTRTRQQLITDEVWYSLPHVKNVRAAINIDNFVYSIYLSNDGDILSGFGFHRRWGREPFTSRERRLLHIISSEIKWLHLASFPEASESSIFPTLPDRFRKVLFLLIQGKRRQDIATQLNLSQHTVNDYVKEIYFIFGVSSHAELIHRFIIGDGGDLLS